VHERVYKVLYGDGYYYAEPSVYDGQCFLIGPDSIHFIYQPYEIAAYAAGFPEFEIAYGQMSDIINTSGAFWNSFDKTIVKSKASMIGSEYGDDTISQSLKTSLSNLVGSYENKIVEAININSFSKVEPYLLKGSTLYNSQVKLVQSLYKKGTREKLVSYEIKAIAYDDVKKEYRLFVSEVVGIKYTGKSYVNKSYDWCYTAKLDSTSKSYKLSDLVKW
jgi:hypothetical protein